jgi:hypothetical protein
MCRATYATSKGRSGRRQRISSCVVRRAGVSLSLAFAAFSIACSRSEQPPHGIDAAIDAHHWPFDAPDANGANDAPTASVDAMGGGGHDAAEGGARDRDGGCATCDPVGGQYCGRIADECSPNGRLECSLVCNVAGFTCGGRGLPNICGAGHDCRASTCLALAATYCGKVGDGCGGTLDCGECSPPFNCGIRGIPGVCGARDDACSPLTCARATVRYCGVIGDGCGGKLDCGECPDGGVCGETLAHMCGADPVPIAIPPPAPIPPLPPAPPVPPVPDPPPPPTSAHRAQD